MPETQFGVRQNDYAGLIWWIPVEFWELTSEAQGQAKPKELESLEDYTTVAVFFARVGGLGTFEFASAEDLTKNAYLVDADGNEYHVLSKVSPEAEMLVKVMKPMLASALGRAGENLAVLYFPAKGKNGKKIADAAGPGSFKIVLRNMMGMKDEVIEIRTPLTALSTPKYCPVDHAKMNGSWKFCPWHGVALDEKPANAAAPAKK